MPTRFSFFRLSSFLLLSATWILSSCQSKYISPPQIPMSSSWSQQLSPSSSESVSGFHDKRLERLLAIAKTDSLDLKLAQTQIDMAHNYYLSQKSSLFPKINASTSASYNHLSKNTINGQLVPSGFSPNLFDVSFNTLWELDFLGKHALARDSAKASLQSASEMQASAWLALEAELSRVYFIWIACELKITLAKEMIATYEGMYKLACERVRHKIASPSQAQSALAALSSVQSQLSHVTLERDVSQRTLELLIGKAPGFLQEFLTGPINLPNGDHYPSLGVPSDLLKRRPDIRSAERKLASATGLVEVAKLDIFPSFTLTGALGQQSMFAKDLTKQSSYYWNLTPGLQLPVFNAGLLKANHNLSKARQTQAIVEYEKCVLNALMEVENALSGIHQIHLQENHLQIAVQAQASILKSEGAKYEQGVSDLMSVLVAQSDFLQAQQSWIDAKLNYLTQILFLKKALGGEWPNEPQAPTV